MNPEILISGGKIAESTARTVEKPPDTGELLKNLTADVSEAVEALQDGTDLLVQQAQHLLLHESVRLRVWSDPISKVNSSASAAIVAGATMAILAGCSLPVAVFWSRSNKLYNLGLASCRV